MDNKEQDEETIANAKVVTNCLKKSNEQHDCEMIQSEEKVVESILKATNATNTPKSRKPENKEKSEDNITRGEQEKAAVEEPALEPKVLSQYMKKRKAKMARNNKQLSELGLDKSPTSEKKQKESQGCKCSHKVYSEFKEEMDKQYFQDGLEIYDTKCKLCSAKFG